VKVPGTAWRSRFVAMALSAACSLGAAQAVPADATISFSFDIANMRTDHQFKGQRDTFHVTYDYAGVLAGPGLDTQGHAVPADTYPYFQEVRAKLIAFIQTYADKNDFYEIFGMKICQYLLAQYPQIRRVQLAIDVPPWGSVKLARREMVTLVRR
jgi:hypothetical protein